MAEARHLTFFFYWGPIDNTAGSIEGRRPPPAPLMAGGWSCLRLEFYARGLYSVFIWYEIDAECISRSSFGIWIVMMWQNRLDGDD